MSKLTTQEILALTPEEKTAYWAGISRPSNQASDFLKANEQAQPKKIMDNALLNAGIMQNPIEELFKMKVTEEIVTQIEDASFLWRELIPRGHMVVICAKPNGGKTTFMVHVAGEIVAEGIELEEPKQVIYINADASASDIKHYQEHAARHGYTLLNPDITGKSNEDVIKLIKAMAESKESYHHVVLILDTLKKFAEVMNKRSQKAFYNHLRALTSKGMTIICLSHTNKYEDDNGKPVYEGTGDIRSDFDDLIYLLPVKNDDGSMTVTTWAEKVRAKIVDITFEISVDREVTILPNKVDTITLAKVKKDLEENYEVIEFVKRHIKAESKTSRELYAIAQKYEVEISRKELDKLLKRHDSKHSPNPLWLAMSGLTGGARYGQISDEYLKELKNKSGA